MSRRAQVAEGNGRGFYLIPRTGLAMLFGLSLMISGCASGGLDMLGVGTDKQIKTGSVPKGSGANAEANTEVSSDEVTVRNAVSSVNLFELGDKPLSWANVGTGSQGAITAIEEFEYKTLRCRKFIASRESFDGVALFSGEVCLQGDGDWVMKKFQPLSS